MRFSTMLIALVAVLISPIAGAQEYPDRPIRIVEPVDPGAAIDSLLFVIGRGITADWGQPGVIELLNFVPVPVELSARTWFPRPNPMDIRCSLRTVGLSAFCRI
jgi:hypothetical protein